jgi:hypothetical protein
MGSTVTRRHAPAKRPTGTVGAPESSCAVADIPRGYWRGLKGEFDSAGGQVTHIGKALETFIAPEGERWDVIFTTVCAPLPLLR